MSEIFKQTVTRLPEILIKNASPMMARVVAAMQAAIADDRQLENASYCVLLLKMTADDLAAGFERAIRESMDSMRHGEGAQGFSATGFSLAIEPVGDEVAAEKADFQSAGLAFAKLLDKGKALGVSGLRNYERDVLYTCLKQAMARSRMSAQEVAQVLPYARRAFNEELVRLYAKLEAL